MSRMHRVRDAIAGQLTKFRSKIEESHKNGKIPSDYSLGMVNGIIFCDHHINMRSGSPQFFDRTTSIGSLPKPVALRTDPSKGDEQIYESLREHVILSARNLASELNSTNHTKLMDSIQTMDKFMEEAFNAQEENEKQQEENGRQGSEVRDAQELEANDGAAGGEVRA